MKELYFTVIVFFPFNREVLLNEEKGMYERYAALFGLRNNGGEEAISAIIESLGAKSALLRQEVYFNAFDIFVFLFINLVDLLFGCQICFILLVGCLRIRPITKQSGFRCTFSST